MNPDIPVSPLVRLDTRVEESISSFRSTALLFLSFAAVALGLAAIGVYGLVSYSVTQRAYEIALRMAVGTTGGSVLRRTLGQSLRLGLVGVFVGAALALPVTRGLSSMLYEVVPADPVVYAQVSAFLLAVILMASVVPAWRSSRVDPVRVSRAQ
jgi:putative ABC transport system permease protein